MLEQNGKIILNENRNFSVVSFFSGCGGLDLGFLGGFSYKGMEVPTLPFDIITSYDNDPKE